jgi:hypothetical protein
MQEKTARLRDLLAQGYTIEAVDSNGDAVVTTLRRGTHVVTLRFFRSEAAELLTLS